MQQTEISIITSIYNDQKFINYAIQSIFDQSFKNWELIIIDDASTDKTPSIINKYKVKDNRIKSYRFDDNKGTSFCLNKGIQISTGKFIARIDSDDLWIDKNKLQKQFKIMQKNPDYAFIGTWAKAIDIRGKEIFDLNYSTDDSTIRSKMLIHNYFVNSSIMLRKSFLRKVGYYETTSKYAQDYGLWLKLGTVGKCLNIPEYMTGYRINPNGISQTKYKDQIDSTLYWIKEYKKFYPNYTFAFLLWNIRKYYPTWFRGKLSKRIKDLVKN